MQNWIRKVFVSVSGTKRVRQPGQSNQARLIVETLPSRTMLSASPVFLHGGVLTIKGTALDDSVHVSKTEDRVIVDFNGTESTFAAHKVKDVVFKGGDGNDDFTNDTDVKSEAFGGNGDDSLVGGSKSDTFDGGAGADDLEGGAGKDVLQGGDGNDTISAGAGKDLVNGGSGDDDLAGDDGDDTLDGGKGNDDVTGDDGDDRLNGGVGDDNLDGGADDDLVMGDRGVDHVSGSTGNDDLRGGGDDDVIDGGLGDDRMDGGSGHDVSHGGGGHDANHSVESDSENETVFTATVSSGTTTVGHAAFQSETGGSSSQTEFELELEHAMANTTYDVTVDGVLVGHLTTNAKGRGQLELNNAADFPAIHDGSSILVGDTFSGTFAQGEGGGSSGGDS